MNVESNLGELEQIVEALDQKHDALSSGGAEVLPELQAVNKLYNRLRESTEEHERNHDLSLEEVHQAYDRVRGRAATAMRVGRLAAPLVSLDQFPGSDPPSFRIRKRSRNLLDN